MAAATPPLLPRRLAAAVAVVVHLIAVFPTAGICSCHYHYVTVAMAMDQGVGSNSAGDWDEDAAAAAVAEAMGRVNIEEGRLVAALLVHLLRLYRRRMDCS